MDSSHKMTEAAAKDGENAIERVREAADIAWEKGRQTWKDLRVQGKDAMADARKNTEEAWEDAQKLVQKHPEQPWGSLKEAHYAQNRRFDQANL